VVPRSALSVRSRKMQRSQRSVIGWVTKNLLYRGPPRFREHVKPLVLAAFAVISTHQSALGVVGYGQFSLFVIHKACALAVGTLSRLAIISR
jgi:hypothetical protein